MVRSYNPYDKYDQKVGNARRELSSLERAIEAIESVSLERKGEHIAVVLIRKDMNRRLALLQRLAERECDDHTAQWAAGQTT